MAEKDEPLENKIDQGLDVPPSVDAASVVKAKSDSAEAAEGESVFPGVEDIAGQGVAPGEVRAVASPAKTGRSLLWPVLIFLLVLFGAGFYLLNMNTLDPSSPLVEGENQPLPKRYAIDKNIEVEVVDPRPVVTVDSAGSAGSTLPAESAGKPAVKAIKTEEIRPLVAASEKEQIPGKPAVAYQVLVGPYLYVTDLKIATGQLQKLGYQTEVTTGRGIVSMFRLLEGVYPAPEARDRLKIVKQQVGDAFLLPAGNKLAIYVGSFSERSRAVKSAAKLASQGVIATLVPSDVEMQGKMLIVAESEQKIARETAARIVAAGLNVQIVRK